MSQEQAMADEIDDLKEQNKALRAALCEAGAALGGHHGYCPQFSNPGGSFKCECKHPALYAEIQALLADPPAAGGAVSARQPGKDDGAAE